MSSTDLVSVSSSAIAAAQVQISSTVSLSKIDSRCRGWVMVVHAGDPLPMPEDVHGAGDVHSTYLHQSGDVELFPGDFLLQGEENHHRKARGWSYWLITYSPQMGKHHNVEFDGETKSKIKAAMQDGSLDLNPAYLKGAGKIASMVRVIHAMRAGFDT